MLVETERSDQLFIYRDIGAAQLAHRRDASTGDVDVNGAKDIEFAELLGKASDVNHLIFRVSGRRMTGAESANASGVSDGSTRSAASSNSTNAPRMRIIAGG